MNKRTLIVSALVIVGCFGFLATQVGSHPVNSGGSHVTQIVTASPQEDASIPQRLRIAKLGIDQPIQVAGLNKDKSLAVPKSLDAVGWYKYSPTPGQPGPAILVGHYGLPTQPGVFRRMHELVPGDIITVEGESGQQFYFKVQRAERYSQNNFPTATVYGPLTYAGLRVITCSGEYNPRTGRYTDNLVVYAERVERST